MRPELLQGENVAIRIRLLGTIPDLSLGLGHCPPAIRVQTQRYWAVSGLALAAVWSPFLFRSELLVQHCVYLVVDRIGIDTHIFRQTFHRRSQNLPLFISSPGPFRHFRRRKIGHGIFPGLNSNRPAVSLARSLNSMFLE